PNAPDNPRPEKNSKDVPVKPKINATYTDPDGDQGKITFFRGETKDGSNKIGTCPSSGLMTDGSRCSVVFKGANEPGTKYHWYARAEDEDGATSDYSNVWSFDTNSMPYSDNYRPSDGRRLKIHQPFINATYHDPDGDKGSMTFRNAENSLIGECTGLTPGDRCSKNYSSATESGATYDWQVIVDDGGLQDTAGDFSFVLNQKPTADRPDPSDNESDVEPQPTVSARYLDLDENDNGTLYFFGGREGSSMDYIGSCSKNSTGGDLTDSERCGVEWTGADSYGANYTWYVNASDGTENGTSSAWEFEIDRRPHSINALEVGEGIDPDPDPTLRADYFDWNGDSGAMEIWVEKEPDDPNSPLKKKKTCTGLDADEDDNDGDRECSVEVDVNDFDELVKWKTVVWQNGNRDTVRNQTYDFRTRTFTSTDPVYERASLVFARNRTSLTVFRGSTETAELVVRNPDDEKNLKLWFSHGRSFTSFSDGSKVKSFTMQEGKREFLVGMRPDFTGEKRVRVVLNNTDLGLTQSDEILLDSRNYTSPGSPPSNPADAREVPGIGMLNLLLIAAASSAYFLLL
ncbi:MAG: hypothetical protein ABEJ03_00215, partial [Candidatus Nanohaloarchaea archaeon]